MMMKNISLVQGICLFSALKHSKWLLLFLFIAFHHSVAAETSKLWGELGELWNRNGVLRDFTSVGYREGAEPIPDWPVAVKVTDFGAKGDGVHDDTQTFRDAIAAGPEKHAILVPKGRYRITGQITLKDAERNYFVLRGENMFESVLFFPLYPAETQALPLVKKTRGQNPANLGYFWFEKGTHRSFENLTFEFRDQPPEADVKSDALYREPVIDKEPPAFAAGLVDNHFEDKLVRSGTKYTYRVTATDTGTRESAPSAELVLAPQVLNTGVPQSSPQKSK